jgi:two-component system, NarL family, response regulator DegU
MTNKTDSLGQKTVLIVEDQALMRHTLHDFLQDAFPDCNFLDVEDGASALEACNAYRPVLVLMDKCLPDADGIELTARLKSLYPGIQVIVISHYSGEIYVQHALAAGARAYLVKDNLTTDLIPAVAAAIGVPGIPAGPDR